MENFPKYKVGLGQDSHRFLPEDSTKPCVIGGVIFEDVPGLAADSDGDVILHALCNAITSISGVPILGGVAQDLCHKNGITDSAVYAQKAIETLGEWEVEHVAFSVEGKRPRLQKRSGEIQKKVADQLGITLDKVGFTATTGDGLTDFGCGEGLQCLCILTVVKR